MPSVLVLIVILQVICVSARMSGFYIDNGVDQTIMEDVLDDESKHAVEHEILELLGLPDRPKHKHARPSLRKSAPQFMIDVYNRLLKEEGENEGLGRVERSADFEENLITDADQRAIDDSDTIMTFLNKNHHVSEVRHERGRRLWFDVSEVSKDLSLMMAELRIYQNPEKGKWQGSGKTFVITAYTITKADGQKELEILSSTNTSSDYQGWLELNVTGGLSKWLMGPNENKGLYIGAHAVDRPEKEIKLDDVGLVNTKGDDQYQPFMVGFFSGQELVKPPRKSRTKRNAPRRNRKSEMRNPFQELKMDENTKNCQIRTLFIHFRDLQWQDWIVAPEGYGAYYCSGECNFPLNAHMNATNHAIVQTLVHLMQPTKVPKPCCAPTALSPISVLYYLEEDNVVLKKYRYMVVKSCGCH